MSTYHVALADDAIALANEVTRLLQEGWRPVGGISIAVAIDHWKNERKGYSESRTEYTFAQGMIKP